MSGKYGTYGTRSNVGDHQNRDCCHHFCFQHCHCLQNNGGLIVHRCCLCGHDGQSPPGRGCLESRRHVQILSGTFHHWRKSFGKYQRQSGPHLLWPKFLTSAHPSFGILGCSLGPHTGNLRECTGFGREAQATVGAGIDWPDRRYAAYFFCDLERSQSAKNGI